MSKQITPRERLGYKAGDKFEVIEDSVYFKKGEIVSLRAADDSSCPFFINKKVVRDGYRKGCAMYLSSVRKVSKLKPAKQALADAIHQNGGWADGGEFAAQDKDGEEGCAVWFYSGGMPYKHQDFWYPSDNGEAIYGKHISCDTPFVNWHQTILSRDEYFHLYPAPDADGWIEWKGGECPVDNDSLVDVKFPDGSEYFNTDAYGDWSSESDTPISHYRQSKKVVKPEFCESVTRSIPEPESIDGLCAKVTEENKHQHVDASPTIEQLAQDYRNAKGYADRLQKEAGEAAVKAESFAVEIRKKILELQELIGIPNPEKEHELEITDWRDLMVGDEVECTKYATAYRFGVVCRIDESSEEQPIMVNHGDGKGTSWPSSWKFIRRP